MLLPHRRVGAVSDCSSFLVTVFVKLLFSVEPLLIGEQVGELRQEQGELTETSTTGFKEAPRSRYLVAKGKQSEEILRYRQFSASLVSSVILRLVFLR